MGSLGGFQSFDAIKPPFVDNQQLRASVNAEFFMEGFVCQGGCQIADELGRGVIEDTAAEGTGLQADGLDEVAFPNSGLSNDNQVRPAVDELARGELLYLLPVDRLPIKVPVKGLQCLELCEVSVVNAPLNRAFPAFIRLLTNNQVKKAQVGQGFFFRAQQRRVKSFRRDRDPEDVKVIQAALPQGCRNRRFPRLVFRSPHFEHPRIRAVSDIRPSGAAERHRH